MAKGLNSDSGPDCTAFCLTLLIDLTREEVRARTEDATLRADLCYHQRQALLDALVLLSPNVISPYLPELTSISDPCERADGTLAKLRHT